MRMRVAAHTPELRRVFLPWPWPHLYEHPKVIANIAVERQYGGEPVVLFGILYSPEEGPLTRTQAYIDHLKNDPVLEVTPFRRALRFARLPWPLRRILWRGVLDVSGEQRAKTLGNFGISPVAATGASQLWIRSPLTTTLYYGPFDSSHSLDVRLVFDHRVIDGAFAGRVLAHLEAVLCDEMPAEIAGSTSTAHEDDEKASGPVPTPFVDLVFPREAANDHPSSERNSIPSADSLHPEVAAVEHRSGPGLAHQRAAESLGAVDRPIDLVAGTHDVAQVQEFIACEDAQVLRQVHAGLKAQFRHGREFVRDDGRCWFPERRNRRR